MLCPPITSPAYTFERQSSPLNPFSDRSSSPIASTSSRKLNPSSPTPMSGHRTRYKRPEKTKYLASAPAELFAEGTTPVEAQLWREKFNKRFEDNERRKGKREALIDRRRSSESGVFDDDEQDEEANQAEDEEVYRRVMVLQRQRAQQAAQIAYEKENGGSDPVSPDFWDEDEQQEAILGTIDKTKDKLDPHYPTAHPSTPITRDRSTFYYTATNQGLAARETANEMDPEEETWAVEAARAEAAEREAEEAEIARQIEEEMQSSQRANQQNDLEGMDIDIDMDWDMDSQ